MSAAANVRAVYRALVRTAARTFAGDEPVRRAFLLKARVEYIPPLALAQDAPEQFSARLNFALEVEHVLRTNIVQAVRTPGNEDVYKLRVRDETERGTNETVKEPLTREQRRPTREQREGMRTTPRARPSSHTTAKTPSSSSLPQSPMEAPEDPMRLNFSALKRLAAGRQKPTLDPADLREKFVRGSGPGGQSINKTENCVQLTHIPTGLRVECQDTRSLQQNRKIALKWLMQKLDEMINPGLDKKSVAAARQRERKRQKDKKKRKAAKLKAGENKAETEVEDVDKRAEADEEAGRGQ